MLTPLLDWQNPDGGWGFRRTGSSWTEPTCYALLALSASGANASGAVRRGALWLRSRQKTDGGWAPRDGVDESTWVTALALLLPQDVLGDAGRSRAARWLTDVTGRESGFLQRLRWRLLGVPLDPAQAHDGWPWFPGAAAWVIPTALSVLALQKLVRTSGETGRTREIRSRIEQGRAFLLARRCRDGGWNHGSTKALGYDSDSYPETTGVALLALNGSPSQDLREALQVAERHLEMARSLEAASWLTLALRAWGRRSSAAALEGNGGTIEIALSGLARTAMEGRNLFLE